VDWFGRIKPLYSHSTEIPVTPTNYGKPNERKAIAIKRGANERDRIKLPGLQNTTRTAQYVA